MKLLIRYLSVMYIMSWQIQNFVVSYYKAHDSEFSSKCIVWKNFTALKIASAMIWFKLSFLGTAVYLKSSLQCQHNRLKYLSDHCILSSSEYSYSIIKLQQHLRMPCFNLSTFTLQFIILALFQKLWFYKHWQNKSLGKVINYLKCIIIWDVTSCSLVETYWWWYSTN